MAVENGKVIIAAAGPGDPDLITIKAARALADAEVILADRLVSPDIISHHAKDTALVIEVGKQGGRLNSTPQRSINELIVDYALLGKKVVRLKGGDVSLYANILDELLILRQHNIPFEIIPGVTAALGAAAYAGIPLTARGYSTGLRVLTYYHSDVISETEWRELSRTQDTLVFYMSSQSLNELSAKLIQHGMPAEMPVAIVEQATTPNQKVHLSELCNCVDLSTENIQTPALIIIGKVVDLHKDFNWFKTLEQQASYFQELPHQTVPPTIQTARYDS